MYKDLGTNANTCLAYLRHTWATQLRAHRLNVAGTFSTILSRTAQILREYGALHTTYYKNLYPHWLFPLL